ncbi:MAG: Chromate transporter [Anaerolineae bacterium 49_20]|nr:MAG: Chromate transporter [Anaerolineae bacterium 49_20]
MQQAVTTKPSSLKDLIAVFLRIGVTSFGSPTAHIAMMEHEAVRKRGWITEEHFLEMLAATNLVPGPNATEMAMHIGYVEAGYPGLIAAGTSFILPSFIATVAMAWLYIRYGSLPQTAAIFYVLNPLVLAIVINTVWNMGKASLKAWQSVLIFGLALAAALLGVDELIIIFGAALLGLLLIYVLKNPPQKAALSLFSLAPLPLLIPFLQHSADWLHSKVVQLFLYFLRTGAVLFGSALVLFPLVKDDVVTRFGWLSLPQLVDAIAVGQMTPGPVSSAVTFIGFMVAGLPGAIAATIGLFLPSFLIVMALGPLLAHWAKSSIAKAILKGVNAGVIALLISIVIAMGRHALVDVWTALLLAAGLAGMFVLKLEPYWLVLAGIGIGIATALF